MDPASIMLFVQAAGEFVQIGKALTSNIRQAVADDPDANLEILDSLDADYDQRIARREEDQ